MEVNIGIWIDTRQAYIIKLKNDTHSIAKIDSNIDTRERELGESKKYGRFGGQYLSYEKNRQNKREQQTTKFLKSLVVEITNCESVVLFGPSNMKDLFENEIKKNPQVAQKLVGVYKSDLITENQMVAWVKKFYNQSK